MMRKDIRRSSYETLLAAKKHPKAVVAYYQFINAYLLSEEVGGDHGNICCMAIDRARELLRK